MTMRLAATMHNIVPVGKVGRMGNFTWVYNNAIDMVPPDWTLRGLEVRGDGNVYNTLTYDTNDSVTMALFAERAAESLKDYGQVYKVENWGKVE